MAEARQISGTDFSDERGIVRFFNEFDMGDVLRFYEISPKNTSIIRAWQGHQKEIKQFYCPTGSFIVNLAKLDGFGRPVSKEATGRFLLEDSKPVILEVPGGYATGIKAKEAGSKLMVYSNLTVEASKNDDFRFPLEQWNADWQ